MEIIIRVDPADVADVEQLMELKRMGAFPPDAVRLHCPDCATSACDEPGPRVYVVETDQEAARYLLALLSDGLAGADPLDEWQRRKSAQTELPL